MSCSSQTLSMNGHVDVIDQLNKNLKNAKDFAKFHGDELIGDKQTALSGWLTDIRDVFTFKNARSIGAVAWKLATRKGLDVRHETTNFAKPR